MGGPRLCQVAGAAISVARAKAAPRRKPVLRYTTLAYQHEQPSHIPSRVATIGSVAFPLRHRLSIRPASQRNACALNRLHLTNEAISANSQQHTTDCSKKHKDA